MPGFLLSLASMVTCSHLGKATPMSVLPSVLVMGAPAVGVTSPYGIVGCTLPPPTVANGPCVTAMFTTASLCVTSFAVPLLLQDGVAVCVPSGTPLLIGASQTQVFGM